MITSLANFRSDLNIIQIPHGDFLAARDLLYVNINLLRTGCSGRSGLNLDEPKYVVLSLHVGLLIDSIVLPVPLPETNSSKCIN